MPAQHQSRQPGIEADMNPRPIAEDMNYKGSGKLKHKVAIITGGDSGIGRAVAIAFAKEGANVVLVYLNEHGDAKTTADRVEALECQCLALAGDVRDEPFCRDVVSQTLARFGKIDILVNNAAEQHPQSNISDITSEQWTQTFQTNVFSYFYMTKAAVLHMQKGGAIINTTSITAYEGHPQLIDYSATKGAIVSFTRSLSQSLIAKGIRVNGVAPGPIWTPLIPSTFSAEQVATFGSTTPMKRPGQPYELAPAYVFLAAEDSSYMAGQILHVNGGTVVNG
ncbi:SDR family oxidoreductase [Alicyclobacillaceae bacterium I2511]|nr:SDR family oxidoreductase [Alicyclobacillaceae bacterium I2511]